MTAKRCVRRIGGVDAEGWSLIDGQRWVRVRGGYGHYVESKCSVCGRAVADRASVSKDEAPSACEVCRRGVAAR